MQGEVVYKSLQQSQGVYFVTKGTAMACVIPAVGNEANNMDGETEDAIKGVVSVGKMFGYTRWDVTVDSLPVCFRR